MMRIRALVLGCVAAAAMLAFAPIASADPAPDICVLDLSQPVDLDQAIITAELTCAAVNAVEVAMAVPIGPDDDEYEACPANLKLTAIDFASHRQHEDPGRCLV